MIEAHGSITVNNPRTIQAISRAHHWIGTNLSAKRHCIQGTRLENPFTRVLFCTRFGKSSMAPVAAVQPDHFGKSMNRFETVRLKPHRS